jgi:hypothetical protein
MDGEEQMATKQQQQAFEGMPVRLNKFKLTGASDLMTDGELAIGDVVGGTWKGRLVGIHHDVAKVKGEPTGELDRVHVIEIDGASID